MDYDAYYTELCRLQKDIDDYQKSMLRASSLDKKYDILKEVYDYLKTETAPILNSGANPSYMKPLALNVHMMAEFLPSDTVIKIKPYDFSDERDIKNPYSIGQILDKLVYEERCRLFETSKEYGIRDFEEIDPLSECRVSALSIYNMARSIGLDAKVKIIEPGFLYDSPLYGGGCKHVVVIINFMGKSYLVDATYKQYFMKKRCILDKIGVLYLVNPNPGTFMVMNESRRKTAEKVLNNGWIELTSENMKNYFDGFTNFYRNGSYYETSSDFSYETPYSCIDYWKFLNGLDNQACHEGMENLGYQKRALINPKMKFDKR